MQGPVEIETTVLDAIEDGSFDYARALLRESNGVVSSTQQRKLFAQITEAERSQSVNSAH